LGSGFGLLCFAHFFSFFHSLSKSKLKCRYDVPKKRFAKRLSISFVHHFRHPKNGFDCAVQLAAAAVLLACGLRTGLRTRSRRYAHSPVAHPPACFAPALLPMAGWHIGRVPQLGDFHFRGNFIKTFFWL
jgi:hypothetical protein